MNTRLFATNALMLIVLVLQLSIGIVIWLINHGRFEASLVTWTNMHAINGIIFTVLVAAHLYMNRRWISLQISGPKKHQDRTE